MDGGAVNAFTRMPIGAVAGVHVTASTIFRGFHADSRQEKRFAGLSLELQLSRLMNERLVLVVTDSRGCLFTGKSMLPLSSGVTVKQDLYSQVAAPGGRRRTTGSGGPMKSAPMPRSCFGMSAGCCSHDCRSYPKPHR